MSHALRPLEDPGSLRRGNLAYFPVVPGRVEFSIALRRAILRERPRIVAVELPGSFEDAYLQALARLPEMRQQIADLKRRLAELERAGA